MVEKAPEKVFTPTGELRGIEGKKEPKAFFHTHCAPLHYPNLPKIECEKCGIFSSAKTLKDGTKVDDVCKCSCHKGKDYCSLLIL
jgi:hypothetical protein